MFVALALHSLIGFIVHSTMNQGPGDTDLDFISGSSSLKSPVSYVAKMLSVLSLFISVSLQYSFSSSLLFLVL